MYIYVLNATQFGKQMVKNNYIVICYKLKYFYTIYDTFFKAKKNKT